MLVFNNTNKKYAFHKAELTLEGLSDRQTVEIIDKYTSSATPRDRLVSIAMRAILGGNDEKAFKKACKTHTKTTSERIRFETA